MKKYGKVFCVALALLLVCQFPALATETNYVTNGDFEAETPLESWTSEDAVYTVIEEGGIDNSGCLQVSGQTKAIITLYQTLDGLTTGQAYKLSFYFKGTSYPYILFQHTYRKAGDKAQQINLFNKVTACSAWRQSKKAGFELTGFTDTGTKYYDAYVGENKVTPWSVTETDGWEYREYVFEIPAYSATYSGFDYNSTILYLGAVSADAAYYDNVRLEKSTAEGKLLSENKTEIKTVLSGNETLQLTLQRPEAAAAVKAIACLYGYNGEMPVLEEVLCFGDLTSGASTVSFDEGTLQTTIHAFPGATQSITVPALTAGKRYALSVFALSSIGTLEPICEKVTLETAAE